MGAFENGLDFERQNRVAEAIQAFRLATQEHPEQSSIWVHLGAMLQAAGQIDESISVFDQAIKVNPSDPYTWEGKARGLMLRDVRTADAEAIALCDRALSLNGNLPEALYVKGRLLTHSDQNQALQLAVNVLDRAIALNPSHAEALVYKGFALNLLSRWGDAIVPARKAAQLNPRLALAWRTLAMAYWIKREFSPALDAIGRDIQLEPNDASAWAVQGGILRNSFAFSRNLSELDSAIASFDHAIALDPTTPEIRKGRDECLRVRRSGLRGGSGLLNMPLMASGWLISSMVFVAAALVGSGQQGMNGITVILVLSGILSFGAWIGTLVVAVRQQRWMLFVVLLIGGLILTPLGLGLMGWIVVLFGKRR